MRLSLCIVKLQPQLNEERCWLQVFSCKFCKNVLGNFSQGQWKPFSAFSSIFLKNHMMLEVLSREYRISFLSKQNSVESVLFIHFNICSLFHFTLSYIIILTVSNIASKFCWSYTDQPVQPADKVNRYNQQTNLFKTVCNALFVVISLTFISIYRLIFVKM